MPDLYLGIDTSNYKTSAAVVDSHNRIIFEKSEYLEVPAGSRGLRQSEAFFRHSCRLPEYIDEVCSAVNAADIRSAGVSSRPRRVEGSYMPCFLAGVNAAREISAVLGIPLHEFSHQEGHAAAVIENTDALIEEESALLHLSGGTTEILICRPDEEGYSLKIAGGTRDISIGQLIDRAGVAMGYPFPSGMYLDELALSAGDIGKGTPPDLPVIRTDGGWFNLSGAETRVLRYIETADKSEHALIARRLFDLTADLLERCIKYVAREYGIRKVFMAGGVSSSSYIRDRITERIPEADVVFSSAALSGDNAAGIARLARRIHESGNSITAK